MSLTGASVAIRNQIRKKNTTLDSPQKATASTTLMTLAPPQQT
jgi:hypothetical protein